jgi:hypothetical protein
MTDREQMTLFERQGEEAYDRMYDAHSSSDATARYSDAKEAFYSAIGIARHLGDQQSVARLETRLAKIKAVFRSQFS